MFHCFIQYVLKDPLCLTWEIVMTVQSYGETLTTSHNVFKISCELLNENS